MATKEQIFELIYRPCGLTWSDANEVAAVVATKLAEENGSSHNKQSKTVTIACTCGKRSATVHLCEQCFEDAVTS